MGLTVFKKFCHDTSLTFNPFSKFQGRAKGKKVGRSWRLFHAMDFQSLMYPSFTFCRILGIFPYKINPSSYEISKPFYILWTVITCVICFHTLISLYEINISGWYELKSLRRIIEINGFYLSSSFIMIVTYVWNGPRMRLLQTILKISSRLPSKWYQKQSVLIHAKDIAGFSFLLMQALVSYHDLQIPVLLKVFSFYISQLVLQMDMLYMNCVCVLKACFKRIDDGLTNLLVVNKPHVFRWFHHEQRNRFLLAELKALEKQHLIVSDTLRMLNTIFSMQIVATVVITFGRMTFFLYFILIIWQDDNIPMNSSEKLSSYIYLISCSVYYFTKIALIVWACETNKDQAIEIGVTVHNVFNRTNDEQIKEELQLFSLQILHTRENIFSARCLTVGTPLLAELVSSIVTYILILMQFLNIISDEISDTMPNTCDQ